MLRQETRRHLTCELLERRDVLSVTFVDSLQVIGSEVVYTAAFADLDSDGDLDALVLHLDRPGEIWLNEGSGRFVDSGERLGNLAGLSAAVGDLDGDGDIDAVVQSSSIDSFNNYSGESSTVVWINDGQAHFDSMRQTERLGALGFGTKLLDMDGDGDLDLLDNGMGVWTNDGEGSFRQSDDLGNYAAEFDFSVADLDGDDDLDVVIPSFVPFRNFGFSAGSLDRQGNTLLPQQGFPLSASSAACGDVDRDGDVDIVFGLMRTDAGPFQDVPFVYLNDGHGNFQPSDNTTLLRHFEAVVGDVEGDGDLDIVARYSIDPYEDAYELWPNDGLGSFGEAVHIGSHEKYGGHQLALADVDADGDLDVFAHGLLWLTNGSSAFHFAGDGNGDGYFDQLDIVQVLQFNRYLREQPATWEEGDWNRDGVFDQFDIVIALGTGNYLQGSRAAQTAGVVVSEKYDNTPQL